ncbi:hypothetical protein Hanom_Chr02g00148921 [Helianthus anomalus]
MFGRDRCFGVLEVNGNARNAKSKGIELSDAKESDLGLIVQSRIVQLRPVGLDFIGPLDIINTTPSEIITAATANNIIVPVIKFVCEQHGICSSQVWVCGVDHSYEEFLRNVAIKWLEYHNVGTPYRTYCDLCSVFPNGRSPYVLRMLTDCKRLLMTRLNSGMMAALGSPIVETDGLEQSVYRSTVLMLPSNFWVLKLQQA